MARGIMKAREGTCDGHQKVAGLVTAAEQNVNVRNLEALQIMHTKKKKKNWEMGERRKCAEL